MNYVDVCTGIDAASVAWAELGWRCAAVAEIEPFPCAVLAERFGASRPEFMPQVEDGDSEDVAKEKRAAIKAASKLPAVGKIPNRGDFTTIKGDEYGAVDLLVGGTPCQDFSVAGLRAGMDGKRGQLTVEFAKLAHRLAAKARSRWVLWENVPGVLSIDGGEAFATFLGILAKRSVRVPEGGWANSGIVAGGDDSFGLAYRVLDAQYAGVPQRRRRVFVVGYFGDWRRAAAVLFERHSLSGDSPPRREKGQVAPTIPARSLGGGGLGTDFDCDGGVVVATIDANLGRLQGRSGQDANHGHSHLVAIQTGCVRENPDSGPDGVGVRTDGIAYTLEARAEVQAICFSSKDHGADAGDISPTLRSMSHDGSHANGGGQVAVCFDTTQVTSRLNRSNPKPGDPCHPLSAEAHAPAIAIQNATRGKEQNGLGISDDGSMYTLDQGSQHGVAIDLRNGTIREEAHTLQAAGLGSERGGNPSAMPATFTNMAVRRLTPRECERLQGFPDDFTKISDKTADGPRYKALGNSMAVPCMRWLGERIQMVEDLCNPKGEVIHGGTN